MPLNRDANPSAEDLPDPIWLPDPATTERTHIAAAMKARGFDSYEQLYDWSVAEPEEFWAYVIETLNIQFGRPLQSVLDLRSSPTSPDWLPGASLNIAESCFTSVAGTCAVIEGSPDGSRREFTYAQLRRLANRVARGLVAQGTQPGQAVAVFMPMTAESVAIYLGIILAGCTVVSIADSFSAEEVRSRLRIGRARAVFTVRSVRRGDRELPVYERVINADGPMAIIADAVTTSDASLSDIPLLRDGDILLSELLSNDASDIAVHATADVATNILFSSGTTGEPKAIVWDHTTPIKAAADGHFHHDIHAGDVVAWPTNLGWMMGPWLIYATLINKGTIALYNGAPADAAFGPFVQAVGVNMLGVVPSMVRRWRETGSLESVDLSTIRLFSSTGECSNPHDMRWLSEVAGGRPIIEYCGGTEVGGGYITSTLVQPNLPAMFSSPALGSSLVILDEQGRTADIGEVFLVPPAMGLSRRLVNRDHHEVYYADVPTDPGGRVLRRHGDQMQRLPSIQHDNSHTETTGLQPRSGGYYRALGRADDTMNLGGIKVGTSEIERTVADIPGIREVAAVAVLPPEGGPDQLVIFAATAVETAVQAEELQRQMQQLIKSRLNPLFRIHKVVLVDQLPRTASNKIMRRTLRDAWLQRGKD
ncbi:MAG: AMP-binding protein [Fuerstiella sp.]|nr:AMP-binding protein [Fuerstiella sp.]MCP4854217.1 AMP-binding protein [Fuerstiella sp.]